MDTIGMHAEAVSLWRRLIPPDRITCGTLRLLRSAQLGKLDGVILEVCRDLRAHGSVNPVTLDLEVATLGRYGGFDAAVSVLEEVIATSAEPELLKLARFRLSLLGIELGRPALVESDPDKLPSAASVSPATGQAVAYILGEAADTFAAVRYAYELVRRNYRSDRAHRAIVSAVIFSVARPPAIPRSNEVRPGFAVRLRDDGSSQSDWVVLEDGTDTPADFTRNEVSIESALARELLGKRLGDRFVRRSRGALGDVRATVEEIVHKTVYRARDSLANFEDRFGGDFAVQVTVKHDESGVPDLTPFEGPLDRREEMIVSAQRALREHRLPVAAMARAVGEPVLTTAEYLAAEGVPVWSYRGTDEELAAALSSLRPDGELVLGPSTLTTLYLTKAYSWMKQLPFRLLATHSTIVEIRRLHRAEMGRSVDGAVMTKFRGRPAVIQHPPEMVERRRADLRDFLTWLGEHVSAVDGTPLAYLPAEDRQLLTRFVGPASAESIAVARSGERILWEDAARLDDLDVGAGRPKRVWTQAVLHKLVDLGAIPEDRYYHASAEMLRLRMRFTRANAGTLLWAAKASDWQPIHPFSTVAAAFADHDASSQSVLRVAAEGIYLLWKNAPHREATKATISLVLRRVSERIEGDILLEQLYDSVRKSLARTDPIAAFYLESHVRNWLLSGSIDDLSWLFYRWNGQFRRA